ncbi:hypothetical protein [Pseudactinotalea sp. Z1748]|uniref:hypothetical protein n=1 Tax=Pseudactinotalea sp. Z1748 TaxID=3413027 RepID=UPI003C7B43E2
MSNPYAPPDPASRPPKQGEHTGPDEPSPADGGPGPGKAPGRQGRAGRPERPKPTPEQLASVSRSVLHFGLFMLAAVLTMQVDLPWHLMSLAFAIGAVVVGVRALVRVFKEQIRGGIVVLLVFGLMLSGMLVVTTLSSLAVWNEQMERQECLRSAITVSAQDRCERIYQEAIEERFGTIPGG